MIYRARFVVPANAPVIENGAIEVGPGTIIAVEHSSKLSRPQSRDFGDAALLPGFVNAHTHLELSLLHNRVPPGPDFVDWLERLVATRLDDLRKEIPSSSANPTSTVDPASYVSRAVTKGIRESLASGVTTMGDISAAPGASRTALAASPLSVVSYGEVIATGIGVSLLKSRLSAAADRSADTRKLHAAISPHSPYTVQIDALKTCVEAANQNNLRLCIHAAETAEEEVFTRTGSGRIFEFLRNLGILQSAPVPSERRPIELLAECGALSPRTLLAHANFVSDADIKLIANSGASVAYCPRTHAAFGHPPHRFQDMLRAGVNVCIGTDSLASNPSLSVLDELRFLAAKYADFNPLELLSMATWRGARALGLDHEVGSLAPGRRADFVIVPIPASATGWDSLLRSNDAPSHVFIDGHEVHPFEIG